MASEIITIDGFAFPRRYTEVDDVENLNYFLENKFRDFGIKDYLSQCHEEIFPGYIGLQSNHNFELRIVKWEHFTIDSLGEYAPGWRAISVPSADKYKADILAYYKSNEPEFFKFIEDRIEE